jgi:hypothetical protein
MIRTIEAVVDPNGNVRLLEDVELPGPRRALVTILDDARTIVGICLEPYEVVSATCDVEAAGMTSRTIMTDDSWLVGPPYAVAEEVFDEHSIEGCRLSPDADDE